jgi:hypothetical protein
VYIGPWDSRRPGEPAFWNAEFGAFARRSDLRDEGELPDAMRAFWERGLALLR